MLTIWPTALRKWPALLAAAAFAISCPLAIGSDFPKHPIRFIVPFAAGSGGDTSGRFFGEQLAAILGQPVLIVNRPGDSGSLGAAVVKAAPPDGYTVLVAGWSAQTVNPIVMKDLSYDPIKDFKPISGLTRSVTGFYVSASSPYKSFQDVVVAAKSGKPINVGTISAGQEIVLAQLGEACGVKFFNVPYKNGSQMLTELAGGQIDMAVEGLTSAGALVKGGKLRGLMVAGDARHPNFPELPTAKESGVADYTSYGWSALYVRSETPDSITDQLAAAMQKVLASDASRAYAALYGSELMTLGAAGMRKFEIEEPRAVQARCTEGGHQGLRQFAMSAVPSAGVGQVYDWDRAQAGDEAAPFVVELTQAHLDAYARVHALTAADVARGVLPVVMVRIYAPLRRRELVAEHGALYAPFPTPAVRWQCQVFGDIAVGERIRSVTRIAEKYERNGRRFLRWEVQATRERDGAALAAFSYHNLWEQGRPEDRQRGRESAARTQAPAQQAGTKLPTQNWIARMDDIRVFADFLYPARADNPERRGNPHLDVEYARKNIYGAITVDGNQTVDRLWRLVAGHLGEGMRAGCEVDLRFPNPCRENDTVTFGAQVAAMESLTGNLAGHAQITFNVDAHNASGQCLARGSIKTSMQARTAKEGSHAVT